MATPRQLAHAKIDLGAASEVVLAASVERSYALFINDSDTVIYLMIFATAVANQGIRLAANGGAFEMSDRLSNLDYRVVNAIHGGVGDKVLLVTSG